MAPPQGKRTPWQLSRFESGLTGFGDVQDYKEKPKYRPTTPARQTIEKG